MEDVTCKDIKYLQESVTKLWVELKEVKEELSHRSEIDTEVKERLLSLELQFSMLQNEIAKGLNDYREDQKQYLDLYRRQLEIDRSKTEVSDAAKWKLIWILLSLVSMAAGWTIWWQ